MKGITLFLLLVSYSSLFAHYLISPSPNPPVELTSFTAQLEDGHVHLFWNTATELNNLGFSVERAIQIGLWEEIGFVEGNGTTNEPRTYEFVDSLFNVVAERVSYRLKQMDFDGTFQYSNAIEILLQQVTLRDTTNQYDYIIITVPEYITACGPFRQHKETIRGFNTLIVDTAQIYAEFDSSATPQDNIRDFISYAGTFWQEPRPKFFLIAGTVSDVPNFLILNPFVPDTVYINTDYYYSQDTYENDSTTTDFYIGRVPVQNVSELENYFSKVIDYESNNTLNDWMNNNLFICEEDTQYGFLDAALNLATELPSFIRSFFISENDTSKYYGNIDSIYSAINNRGSASVWFIGHANDSVFAYSHIFDFGDLNGLSNYQKYFFSAFAGQQRAIIDSNSNLTKEMMVIENSGSIGGSVFVGPPLWGIGNVMRREWAERLFDPSIESLGEAFFLDSLEGAGLFGYMKKISNLWADPSLKLKYDTTVGVEEIASEPPESFSLYQNYPNPFNPSTTIKFTLPAQSNVKLNIYNALGQLVSTLVDKEMSSGYHEVNFDASKLASGVYMYQLQAGEFNSVKKMLLLK